VFLATNWQLEKGDCDDFLRKSMGDSSGTHPPTQTHSRRKEELAVVINSATAMTVIQSFATQLRIVAFFFIIITLSAGIQMMGDHYLLRDPGR